MSAIAEILETIAHAPVKKRAITNHNVLNEAFAYAKAQFVFARHEDRFERADDSADLRHSFDR